MVQANYSAAQVPVGTVPVASPSTTSANKVNQAVTGLLRMQCDLALALRTQTFRVSLVVMQRF